VDNPNLDAAFDDALDSLAAKGLSAPTLWSDSIKPISWPVKIGMYAPPRRFVAKGWIPYGCVTSLYGQGGIGKSMAAQLLATAVVTGRYWLGIETVRCRVLALFCEDDEQELWRRQQRINGALGVEMSDLVDFMPDARTGQENVLAVGRDVLQTTELFDHLTAAIAELKPGLVILDNIAQMFAGSENDRGHVTQFVNFLARLARDGDCAVVLLGHVAKVEGSSYSGSTAWDAAVRSRLLLAHEGERDDRRLMLSHPKSNYSQNDSIEVEWRDGMLHAVNQSDDTPSGKLERGLRNGQADQAFLDALDALRERGIATSESKQASTFAPKVIDKHELLRGFTTRDMAGAMQRLFNEGRIAAGMVVCKGTNRHPKHGLGRMEWAAETGPERGSEARSSNGLRCAPVGSLKGEPTEAHSPGREMRSGSTRPPEQSATEAQNQSAPGEHEEFDL
jgi:hypothetical protein